MPAQTASNSQAFSNPSSTHTQKMALNPTPKDDGQHAKLASLLAAGGGVDTFGNEGTMRVPVGSPFHPSNRMLITEAAKFYALAGSAEEYLQVLRNFTADVHLLGHSLRRAMQLNEATLLEPSPTKTKQTFEDEDEKIEASQPFVHVSALPGEVVIIDDPHSYSQFTMVIIACPHEEVCKQLAKPLGATSQMII
ncbi:hypothetical protein MJO29_003603 [Puccinia striiformis f. sp. tritici]|nr:hypothetical protein MJO29_003603 [Puccinia striiformis f. sp. tritici]